MYTLEDLFDKRSSVGARLEQILEEKKCTKAELYKGSGVSRPTIDKLLAGTITNKTNYEKHMAKVIKYLQITPDLLLGNSACGRNKIREIRNTIMVSTNEMAKATGISMERLSEIEAGDQATLAELRDVAAVLHTSTRVLKGDYFFEPQMGDLDYFVDTNSEGVQGEISGFWGHIGILLEGKTKYMWYPITRNTCDWVQKGINNHQLVIPCMNNKVLFLYMPNVKAITLLDEACDGAYDKDWDDEVDCGEIPLVVYEILGDYVWDSIGDAHDIESDILSPQCRKWVQKIVDQKNWQEDDICSLIEKSKVYYTDGLEKSVWMDFYNDNVSDRIAMVYGFELSDIDGDFLHFVDGHDESIVFLNLKRISMLELPLLKLEKAICEENAEWI